MTSSTVSTQRGRGRFHHGHHSAARRGRPLLDGLPGTREATRVRRAPRRVPINDLRSAGQGETITARDRKAHGTSPWNPVVMRGSAHPPGVGVAGDGHKRQQRRVRVAAVTARPQDGVGGPRLAYVGPDAAAVVLVVCQGSLRVGVCSVGISPIKGLVLRP